MIGAERTGASKGVWNEEIAAGRKGSRCGAAK